MRENVPQSEVIRIVAGADLLVQPSFHEGFGLPVLEATAVGTRSSQPAAASCSPPRNDR
jgi:glycosyltransferase involved in cell wall biosynthesis